MSNSAHRNSFDGPVGNTFDKYNSPSRAEQWVIQRFMRHVSDVVSEVPATKVLDVGCAEGQLASYLTRRIPTIRITATDAGDPRLMDEWTKYSNPRLRFEEASVYELPYGDNAFQMVTVLGVLQHLRDPHRALQEIARVSSGWCVASVPWEPAWRAGNVVRGRYVRHLGNTPGHVNRWTARRFARVLSDHGTIDHSRRSTVWSIVRVAF